ncbi:hypothetical protein [Bradyrhizobium arachidis]|uniref:hypothetical protein n=1 Tax=Bradyrhizobium arachidis TaxID=858423 RepID=UPI002163AB2E|nr:hypothetical protein [Bradyrhizobium arachidis]UVO30423.1 hypothetical protein KUF59_06845 [Bradyrhizobium arachidis]
MRFETAPDERLQIDFGERLLEIGGDKFSVYLIAATLGYSRKHRAELFATNRRVVVPEHFAGLTDLRSIVLASSRYLCCGAVAGAAAGAREYEALVERGF